MLTFMNNEAENNADQQQTRVISLFSLVGMSMTFMMGFISLFNSNHELTITLFFASMIYCFAYISLKKYHTLKLSSYITIYSLYLLMFYLVFTGGVEQTGPLWIFIVAPVSVYILGLTSGLINLAFFLTVIAIIIFLPTDSIPHVTYSMEFKLRLILSFLTTTFLSALYEYLRMISFKSALELGKKYQQLALSDPLTKLANRRNALTILQQEKSRTSRNDDPLSILLCDLDHFKMVNDKYGHNCGDMVLTELAQVFTKSVRQQDCVARWGGEEFLFILPQTSAEQAFVIAEKIRINVQRHSVYCHEQDISLTISIGISQLTDNQTIDEMINNADRYLYQAKKNGRNQVYPQ
ncbi:GGDEF domain-containing protein [Shewanella sp. MEBiC00475]|uniref:GGDEF domain-containing protein n=1 Tax=Shewanella sp. MEBiC00475 TaxID=2575361 RepID=UPI0010C125C3|nr:GGDEF domain-containing protein [Shewanella sp. MEBiC00475]